MLAARSSCASGSASDPTDGMTQMAIRPSRNRRLRHRNEEKGGMLGA
jgi:hypothetical protein